jgi:peroxiredoxin
MRLKKTRTFLIIITFMLALLGCKLTNRISGPDQKAILTLYVLSATRTTLSQFQYALEKTASSLNKTQTASVITPSPINGLIKPAFTIAPTTTLYLSSASPFPISLQSGTPAPTLRADTPINDICILIDCLAPNFTLPTVSGKTLSLSDFRGKSVLLNFWATTCPPCQNETPILQKIYSEYQNRDLVVLGISNNDKNSIEAVPKFIRGYNLTFPILLDTNLTVSALYRATYYTGGIPRSYFIDVNGIIRDIADGALKESEMRAKVLALLGWR